SAFGTGRSGHTSFMPTDRSGRRQHRGLSFALGLSAIFDLTGAAIFRIVRPNLPTPLPIGSRPDPFRSAMDTIMAAHREVVPRRTGPRPGGDAPPSTTTRGASSVSIERGVTLPASWTSP